MVIKGSLKELDYDNILAEMRLRTPDWEAFLNACESEYLAINTNFYHHLNQAVFRYEMNEMRVLNDLLMANPQMSFEEGKRILGTFGTIETLRDYFKVRKVALDKKRNKTVQSSTDTQNMKVFLSYAHVDEALKDQLNVFLAPLRRSGKIAVWHDRQILPGEEWDSAIKKELAEADIILLLVSPHFLASDYIWHHEISKAMERHERRETAVVPIILKPCDWTDMPFAKLQALPRNAKPVTQHTDQDEAFMDVVKGIKRVLEA